MATTNDGQFEVYFRTAGEDAFEYAGSEALYTAAVDPDDEDEEFEDDDEEFDDEDDDEELEDEEDE